jgi:CBS-domain-containing membrane protein
MDHPHLFCAHFDKLSLDDPLSKAIALFQQQRLKSIPVVDDRNVLVGTLSIYDVLELLLPGSMRRALGGHDGAVFDLSFMTDDPAGMQGKLAELDTTPVGKAVKRDIVVVHSDTPLMEAILLLVQNRCDIPMVERDSGELRCMLSAPDLLHALHDEVAK